jgi:hypothetical protein
MIRKLFVKYKTKNVSQTINNLESKNNKKIQINQGFFFKQALVTKLQRLYPCDKNQKQNLRNLQRKLSISENESNARFKLINQYFTSVIISSQIVEAKLGRKKKKWLSTTLPTRIIIGCNGA